MKATKNQKYSAFILFFLFTFSLASTPVFAKSDEHNSHAKEFIPGEFIMHHVADAFEWHLATIGETHITVPLPIILYSKTTGWHVFMSSRFEHGHASYHNFQLAHEGENAGKIEELNAQGEVVGLPINLSITKSITGAIFSVILMVWIFLAAAKSAKRNAGQAPRGVLNVVEPIIVFVRDEIAKPAIGEHKFEKFMPYLLTLFFFILLNNLMGLIPIFPFGANVTGNIAVTMVLALFTFAVTNINGNKYYWKEIFNPDVPWWLKFPIPMMPIIELSGMFTKPFVLMVRLFANMMAGHMIVTVFLSLIFIFGKLMGTVAGLSISPVSIAFSLFIMMLDILVSFIQAYVFTLLSALYFGMAKAEHH
ncbi:F0F1 ATP synthase subunit A [Sunxiuqinia sp. sy24]|uniref:F0F1 ATP synthase subunit A n=1 Tax=Sunxiuqinia sp. sy24 TaxID=3461495 RepID=UPI004046534C